MPQIGKMTSRVIFTTGSLLSVAFVSSFESSGEFSIWAVLVKLFPIVYLMLYVNSYVDALGELPLRGTNGDKFCKERRHLATGVLCGLVCSGFGDMLLLLRSSSEFFFLLGTGAFALAQMSYINAMGFQRTRMALGFLLYVGVASASYFILRGAPFFTQVVLSGYGALLITSVWRAIDRSQFEDGRTEVQKKLLVLGFVTFLASDIWIGISTFLFKSHSVTSIQFILSTYYAAQGMIVMAIS